jgi:hypothetical protein
MRLPALLLRPAPAVHLVEGEPVAGELAGIHACREGSRELLGVLGGQLRVCVPARPLRVTIWA